MYIDVVQHLEDLKAKLGKTSKTYEVSVQAYMDFPALRAHSDHGTVRLCTDEANYFVDKLEILRGDDIYVYPYMESKGVLIYSDPPFYFVGFTNKNGFGFCPAPGWTEEMKADRINPDIIKKVQSFLNNSAAVDY